MSSNSIDPFDVVPHYAYLVIRLFPADIPRYLAVRCHYGDTNDIFFLGG
jgi:hypothetical protein